MVKKAANKLKIDFEKCIIEDKLLQVKNHGFFNDLALINTWSIKIPPSLSKKVVNLVREFGLKDISLTHIKRIQKTGEKLVVIICSEEYLKKEELIKELNKNEIDFKDLRIQQIPKHCPSTKELAIKWSSDHWPLLWKGNPNDQILNEVKININEIKNNLKLISTKVRSIETLPICSMIFDPISNEVINVSIDERHLHPLNHSIMRCIQNVAIYEQTRRKTCKKEEQHYLCENYHVYTTHEPCTMCSMALIHSRISRLIYLKQMDKTGALNPKSNEGYVIQNHKLLNSSFEVWEWLGNEFQLVNINENLNA